MIELFWQLLLYSCAIIPQVKNLQPPSCCHLNHLEHQFCEVDFSVLTVCLFQMMNSLKKVLPIKLEITAVEFKIYHTNCTYSQESHSDMPIFNYCP